MAVSYSDDERRVFDRKAGLLVSFLALAPLAGCVSTVEYSKSQDFFSAIDASRPRSPLSNLTLALVTTQNSQLALNHLAENKQLGDRFFASGGVAELDPAQASEDLIRFLRTRFKDVVKVASPDQAAGAKADLTVVLDLKIQLGKLSFQTTVVEITASFRSDSGEVLDTVQASGKSTVPYPASTFNFMPAWKEALRQLDNQIDAAGKVTAFAAEHDRKTALSNASVVATTGPAAGNAAVDLAFWDSVKGSSNPADLQAYLQKFPSGSFSGLARTRLTALGEALPGRLKPLALPADGNLSFGNYHTLVIGIDDYRAVTPLKTAVNDARTVAALLQNEYGFKVRLLENATRNQMLDAFDDVRRTLTESDNLLIYYAGHGYLDVDSDRGFWLPVDADANRRANWLSNSDIADVVRGTRAKHVLVVADSCYAGTLTRSLSVQMTALDNFSRLAQKRARTALVSGGLEPVEDAGGGNHSVFAKAFLDALAANTGVVDMSQMFATMRRQVIMSAQQTPQYGDIRQTGHEGGDFIFVRRK